MLENILRLITFRPYNWYEAVGILVKCLSTGYLYQTPPGEGSGSPSIRATTVRDPI